MKWLSKIWNIIFGSKPVKPAWPKPYEFSAEELKKVDLECAMEGPCVDFVMIPEERRIKNILGYSTRNANSGMAKQIQKAVIDNIEKRQNIDMAASNGEVIVSFGVEND